MLPSKHRFVRKVTIGCQNYHDIVHTYIDSHVTLRHVFNEKIMLYRISGADRMTDRQWKTYKSRIKESNTLAINYLMYDSILTYHSCTSSTVFL